MAHLCPPRKPGGCTQLVPISQPKSALRQRPHWAKMSQMTCTSSIAARPTKRNGPQIIARHPQHCGPHKTRSETFIRPYLGQKRLPAGSSLLIGKPKTSAFRSCRPQRLNQRTLKVTVQIQSKDWSQIAKEDNFFRR